jgi:hypothetical protein
LSHDLRRDPGIAGLREITRSRSANESAVARRVEPPLRVADRRQDDGRMCDRLLIATAPGGTPAAATSPAAAAMPAMSTAIAVEAFAPLTAIASIAPLASVATIATRVIATLASAGDAGACRR